MGKFCSTVYGKWYYLQSIFYGTLSDWLIISKNFVLGFVGSWEKEEGT